MSDLPFRKRLLYHPPAGMEFRAWQTLASNDFFRKQYESDQFIQYLVYAGVGSGKTRAAAYIAARALNERLVDRVVYVCPNRAIQRAVRRTFEQFNIKLALWHNKKHSRGETVGADGAVATYQSISRNPELQRDLVNRKGTLVIFDEIHHLGDNQAWESAAQQAFGGHRAMVLGLTGTPYRNDNKPIPFVHYLPEANGLRQFKPDFTYTLGQAVADGFCREPLFEWEDEKMLVPFSGGDCEKVLSESTTETANRILSAIVQPDAPFRKKLLARAVAEQQKEGRKVAIFVGGDSLADTKATEDAEENLPRELIELGVPADKIISVTSQSAEAAALLEKFAESSADYLVTVNMFSEGVDIPVLSCAVFLTAITAKSTTIQRIGRVLRGSGSAYIFMAKHPAYVELSEEIKKSILHEVSLKKLPPREEPQTGGQGARPELVHLSSWADGVTYNGQFWSEREKSEERARLVKIGLQHTEEMVALALLLRKNQ